MRFLRRFPRTERIIVNGGDPLMVNPSYYEQIINDIREHQLPTTLELCTNLWDWYIHPNKWDNLFRQEEVNIGTSFDYFGRMITPTARLTEEKFIKMMETFKESFGYTPSFVSVLSKESKEHTLKLVRLAKLLGVECKINPLLSSGRSEDSFTIGDAYNTYLDIYEAGLTNYEMNTKQMIDQLKVPESKNLTCPQNRRCDEGIRNLQPEKDGYEYGSCGAFGDDRLYGIPFEEEMNGNFFKPLQRSKELQYQKEECFSCSNFNICNGCYKIVHDLKSADYVEQSCKRMKSFRTRVESLGLN